jgi:hypothetical protein
LVCTVRTDAGFGRRKPGEVRTFYSSTARPTPMRCGAPFPAGALAAFAPRADASCANPIVAVDSEDVAHPKTALPKIASALKGDAMLGDTMTVVAFGSGPLGSLGIVAPTPEIAAELQTKLASGSSYAPELVCGAPHETRRVAFSLKTGALTPLP